MERFGASAPLKVLEKKFGYTVENLVSRALEYMQEFEKTVARMKAL